jgi:hypothetical protein
MVTRKPIDLKKQWITKPLHKDTFTQVIVNSSSGTADRLYMLTNNIEARQEFLETEDESKLSVKATVSIKPGYAKRARSQAEVLNFMSSTVTRRPEFTISLYVYEKENMLELFSFKHKTTNKQEVYRTIDMLEKKVIDML